MRVQLELTTRCNFTCFYCAGREMVQGDMAYETGARLLDAHVQRFGVPFSVSLQGEGEPTMHPRFFDFAQKVRDIGSQPYTITNGTYKQAERFAEHFEVVGVSLDTLDPQVATRIGRHNLPKVVRFIDRLSEHVRVVVHTVALARDLPAVQRFCEVRGLRHVVQPLQPKADYARRYPDLVGPSARPTPFRCAYLEQPIFRYYSLDGTELPCCFIKDTSQFAGIEQTAAQARAGHTPEVCRGCIHGVPA